MLRHRFERLAAGTVLGFGIIATPFIAVLCFPSPVHADGESTIRFDSERNLSAGAFALEFGRFDKGIWLTQKGLEAPHPRHDRSAGLSNLCAGFVGSEKYALAIVHCTSALELNEKNWQAYNNRGYAYYKLGDLEAARRDVRRG
jgi:tetratricopeptide (TPR) repeat protein